MGELQEKRAAGAEKDRLFAGELPHYRVRPIETHQGLLGDSANVTELALEIGFGDGIQGHCAVAARLPFMGFRDGIDAEPATGGDAAAASSRISSLSSLYTSSNVFTCP